MASSLNSMTQWSNQIEEELTLLLKEWLKSQGRTQADLKKILKADSSRIQSLLEVLKKDFYKKGLPEVAARLCMVEENWANNENPHIEQEINPMEATIDPCDQLDLLLDEIREDCES